MRHANNKPPALLEDTYQGRTSGMLKNMSIVSRVYCGFAISIGLLMTTVIYSSWSSSRVISSFEKLVDRHFEAQRALTGAKIDFLLARRSEKDLLYADDPILVKNVLKLTQSASEQVAKATALLNSLSNSASTVSLERLSLALTAYESSFKTQMKQEIGSPRTIHSVKVRKTAKEVEDMLDNSIATLGSAIDASKKQTVDQSALHSKIGLLFAGATVFLGLLCAWAIGRSVSGPVQKLQKLIHMVQQSADLTLRSKTTENHELGMIAKSFDSLMERFAGAVQVILSATADIDAAVNEIRDSGYKLRSNSEHQMSITKNLNQIAQEASASLTSSRESFGKASELTTRTQVEVDIAMSSMRSTVESVAGVANLVNETGSTISELNISSSKIGSIIATIKEIADQTNLLALNAAIEAARAGEQGRGFAVVADEVRKLAEDTRMATEKISDLIETIQSQIGMAVKMTSDAEKKTSSTLELVNVSETGMTRLRTESANLTQFFGMIGKVLREQNDSMGKLIEGIHNISNATETNAESANTSAQLAGSLETKAIELNKSVTQFKVA
ncbi:MAG: methyl-accepting chemotaxis protein [Burkholderiaceae bacterium]